MCDLSLMQVRAEADCNVLDLAIHIVDSYTPYRAMSGKNIQSQTDVDHLARAWV